MFGENCFFELEEMCIKNKWFEELSEKYLEHFGFFKKAKEENLQKYFSWLNKAQDAGYKEAISKKQEAKDLFNNASVSPLTKLFKKK